MTHGIYEKGKNSSEEKEAGQMKMFYFQMANFAILSVLLPFFYGCQGGGDGALGFSSSGGGGSIAGGGTGGGEITTIVNPEPATMLLLGSGFAAMAWHKRKNKNK